MFCEKRSSLRLLFFILVVVFGAAGQAGSALAQSEEVPNSDEIEKVLASGDERQIENLLRVASQAGRHDVVGYVLDNYAVSHDVLGEWLCRVTHRGSVDMVKVYLEHGADPNYESPYGQGRPIFIALWNNNDINVMKVLLEYGADTLQSVDVEPFGHRSLFYMSYSLVYPKVLRAIMLEKFKLLAAVGAKPYDWEVDDSDKYKQAIQTQYVIDILGYFPGEMP